MTTGKFNRKTARAELTRIARQAGTPDAFRGLGVLIDQIFNPKTPSYKLGLREIAVHFRVTSKGDLRHIPETVKSDYETLQDSLEQFLISRGYRDLGSILTWQEHYLMGSSRSDDVNEDPYIPRGFLGQKLTLEEITQARGLTVVSKAYETHYSIPNEDAFPDALISLELLDTAGKTLRDPRLLDIHKLDNALATLPSLEQVFEECEIPADKSPDFPFRRD